jgi:hypothetical protein
MAFDSMSLVAFDYTQQATAQRQTWALSHTVNATAAAWLHDGEGYAERIWQAFMLSAISS